MEQKESEDVKYKIEKILKEKRFKKSSQFLIKWKGYNNKKEYLRTINKLKERLEIIKRV